MIKLPEPPASIVEAGNVVTLKSEALAPLIVTVAVEVEKVKAPSPVFCILKVLVAVPFVTSADPKFV